MLRMNPEDFSLVLKPRVTANLKDHFKPGELSVALVSHVSTPRGDTLSVWPIWEQNIVIVTTQDLNVANALVREFTLKTANGALPMAGHAKINGEVCRGGITVHEKETSETLKSAVQWQEGEMAFIRKLGKSAVALITFVGREVPRNAAAIAAKKWAPPQTAPTCLICVDSHLTGSQACTGKFRRIQHVHLEINQNRTPRAGGENKRRGASRGTAATGDRAPASQKKTQQQLKTAWDQGAPALSSSDFPALGNSGGATSSPDAAPHAKINKVGRWVGVASRSLCPPPSPELNELRQELAALRAENAKLITKISALEEANKSAPLPLPSLPSPVEIPAVEAEPIGEVPLQEEHINLDSLSTWVIALEEAREIRILGPLYTSKTARADTTLQKLRKVGEQVGRMVRPAFVTSRILYSTPYLHLRKDDENCVEVVLRKIMKLDLPITTSNAKLLALSMVNTYRELREAQPHRQYTRLAQTESAIAS
ncbi:hypothetical protein HPB48_001291 [Haemaphysalis longicornis]|uniref:Uncharacterized protein n=1 Tax=Haemaphysalis longicornis TaxID=44386 RepID=A0A9J6FMF1_HAELO|nr:hypothetical protein HPB48_001291 [Haemaphysalis longicornis]